jgi:hypothetical protein
MTSISPVGIFGFLFEPRESTTPRTPMTHSPAAAVIASRRDPAEQNDFFAFVGGTQVSATVGALELVDEPCHGDGVFSYAQARRR